MTDTAQLLANLALAWEDAGRPGHEWSGEYLTLLNTLSHAVKAQDNGTIRGAREHLAGSSVLPEFDRLVSLITETEAFVDPRTGTRLVAELIAIPVNIFVEAPAGTLILGKPVGPDLMQPLERQVAELLGGEARVKLIPAFYDKQDLLQDYPALAWQLRQRLMGQLENPKAPRMLTPAAAAMNVTALRRKFLRFVIGVSVRDFAGGRLLSERRFAPQDLARYQMRCEEELFLLMQRMGSGMTPQVAPPMQLSPALTSAIVFTSR